MGAATLSFTGTFNTPTTTGPSACRSSQPARSVGIHRRISPTAVADGRSRACAGRQLPEPLYRSDASERDVPRRCAPSALGTSCPHSACTGHVPWCLSHAMCHVLCCTRRCRPDCTAGVLAPDDLSAACKESVDPDPACYEENLFKRRYLRALVSTALRYQTGRLVAGTCAALVSTVQSARDDLRARPGRPAVLLPRVPHRAHAAASAARVHRAGREHEGAAGVRRLGQARKAARTSPRCDPPPLQRLAAFRRRAPKPRRNRARALVPRDGRAGVWRRSLP